MGAEFSNPLDEQKQEQIQKIVEEFVSNFSQIFPGSYKTALIEEIREGAQPEEEDENQLPEAPTPDSELKAGTITKKCVFMSAWKPNHFIAYNKSENYRIDYYDQEGGSRKGSINCCGYKPEKNNAEELAPFGIKVVPSSESRRTFYLKFDTEEDRDEWLEVIKNACSKAEPAKDEDKLIRKAFGYAYHDIRVHYGYYGGYRLKYSEAEELGDLLAEIIYRDVARGIINNVAPGMLHGMTVKAVRKFVDSTAMTAVSAAWNAGREGCKNAKAGIEEAAKTMLEPMFAKEAELKDQIGEKMAEKMNPFIERMSEKVFTPLLDLCVNSIMAAYVSSMTEFATFMMKEVKEGNFKGDKLAKSIKSAHRSIDMWHHGMLADTNQILWKLYDSELKTADAVFSAAGNGYSSHELYSECLDGIRDLAHRGVHAFFEAMAGGEEDKADAETALKEVFGRYVHDSKLSLKSVITSILAGLVQPTFESTILNGAMTVVEPIQAVIDAVPGLADLFSLSSFTEDVLQGSIDGAVGTAVDTAFANVEAKLDEKGEKIAAEVFSAEAAAEAEVEAI